DGAQRTANVAGVRLFRGSGTGDGGHGEHPFHVTKTGRKQGHTQLPARSWAGRAVERDLRWSGVCPEQSGTAARRAYFGPDYQSPSRASLPVATHGGARPHLVTPEETHARAGEIPGRTSLVRALALHGVACTQPLGLTPWAGERCPDPERLSTV